MLVIAPTSKPLASALSPQVAARPVASVPFSTATSISLGLHACVGAACLPRLARRRRPCRRRCRRRCSAPRRRRRRRRGRRRRTAPTSSAGRDSVSPKPEKRSRKRSPRVSSGSPSSRRWRRTSRCSIASCSAVRDSSSSRSSSARWAAMFCVCSIRSASRSGAEPAQSRSRRMSRPWAKESSAKTPAPGTTPGPRRSRFFRWCAAKLRKATRPARPSSHLRQARR